MAARAGRRDEAGAGRLQAGGGSREGGRLAPRPLLVSRCICRGPSGSGLCDADDDFGESCLPTGISEFTPPTPSLSGPGTVLGDGGNPRGDVPALAWQRPVAASCGQALDEQAWGVGEQLCSCLYSASPLAACQEQPVLGSWDGGVLALCSHYLRVGWFPAPHIL